MPNASVKPQQCFSDATCDQLTGILLTWASCAPGSAVPSTLAAELVALRDSDEAFRHWGFEQATALQQPIAVNQLAENLVQQRRWARESGTAQTTAASQRLMDAAGLVVRLRAFESSFAHELESQKQQALYNFAYGLSHELNNPLANIATRAGVLAQQETSKHRASLLHAIIDNAMRGSEMLGDLMLVARPPAIALEPTSLRGFIDSLAERAKAWAEPFAVTILVEHARDASLAIDPTAMREAVWALVRNGIEAMPTGGQLTIRTLGPSSNGDPAQYVIEILDEGQGLTPDALANCFDPYYSGREAGRGLGLGLSKAQRIVNLHGGRLVLANRPGRGCIARIELCA